MISLAILHATLPTYMAQAQVSEAKHFDLQLASSNLTQFRLDLTGCNPRVLVLDLACLAMTRWRRWRSWNGAATPNSP